MYCCVVMLIHVFTHDVCCDEWLCLLWPGSVRPVFKRNNNTTHSMNDNTYSSNTNSNHINSNANIINVSRPIWENGPRPLEF